MSKNRGLLSFVKKYKDSIFIREFIIIFAIVMVLLTAINIIMVFTYSRLANDQFENRNRIIFDQLKNTGENIIDGTDKIAYSLMLDPEVSLFSTVDWSSFDNKYRYENSQSVLKYISNHLMIDDYINNIIVYSAVNDGTIAYNETTYNDLERFKLESANNSSKKCEFYEDFIECYYPINESAFIVIRMDLDKISEKLKNEEASDYEFYTVGNDGTVYFSNIRKSTGTRIDTALLEKEGNEKLLRKLSQKEFSGKSEVNSWRYVYLYPEMSGVGKIMNTILFVFFAISVVIAALIAYMVAIRMYKPILNIVNIFENPHDDVKMNNLHKNKMFGEFELIADNIISTFSTYDDIKEELEEKMRQLNEHQMMVLQSQISPHFLFNTLEVINLKAMMLNGLDNEVSEMISDLSKLLRIGLESKEQLFTIRNELEHVKLYIGIMKLRYYDKFDVVFDVDNELLGCKICKITLQPLVENAISYGIKMMSQNGTIKISGRKDGDLVYMEVADNGVGMTDERLEEIRKRINSEEFFRTESIGLQNVNRRIKLLFGEEYGIEIDRNESGGITVRMTIPYIKGM